MAVFPIVSVASVILTVTLTSAKVSSWIDRLDGLVLIKPRLPELRICKPTGQLILKSQICDRYQDCPDDSDEINCICDTQYQYGCKNGRCIYKAWLCDGVKDCPEGDDEMSPQCADCQQSQFQCKKSRACISSALQCDGKPNCDDSSDESQCVSLTAIYGIQQLTVTYKGASGWRLCSDNWNPTWSNRVCNIMGFGTASSTNYLQASSASFVSLNSGNPSSNFMASLTAGRICVSQRAVSIICRPAECGKRTVPLSSVGQYILNGQRAQRGAWPWQAFFNIGYYNSPPLSSRPRCGGILINSRWILTAGHCTRLDGYDSQLQYAGDIRPANIQIYLGTISRNDNPDRIVAYADRVITHPQYNSAAINNDVGLIRLSQTVSFSDTVRPICLPDKNQDLKRFKVCVDTGFGTTLRDSLSDDLLQGRMNIRSDTECSQANSYYRSDTQMCIGTAPTEGDINICFGDSGGPFSCQDPNGVWMAIGVNSYVSGTGGTAKTRCERSFVARIPAFVDWIKKTISENSN